MATINIPRPAARRQSDSGRSARREQLARRTRRNGTGYLFMAGAILCFALFSWYPMVREVIMSFQRSNFAGQTTWVGLQNYRHIVDDPDFWNAWKATATFAGLALVFGYALPFLVAIVLNEMRHGRTYFSL